MTLFTNRRKILMGLVSATTAAATGSTVSGATAPQEHAELVAMSDALEGTLQAYLDALSGVERIAAQWGPQWPTPDPEIYCWGEGCKTHCDILGQGVQMPWGKGGIQRVHDLGTPEYFKASAAHHRKEYERKAATKSGRGAKFHKKWMERNAANVAPARAYWSEVERITTASGITPAIEHRNATRAALQSLVGEIVTFDERTITGLIIKAQAMQAWGNVEEIYRLFNPDALAWADAMTLTIIRQTSSAGAP